MHFKLEAVNQHGDSNAYKIYVHNYKKQPRNPQKTRDLTGFTMFVSIKKMNMIV